MMTMDEMKMEWGKMMDSMMKLDEGMKGMDMKGMEAMGEAWSHMMSDAKKMQDMMAMKGM